MKVKRGAPPNYKDICKRFNVRNQGVVFAYGDTIYNPKGIAILHHMIVHEETHSAQQEETGPEEWWKRYLSDRAFRLSQEMEAYRNQYDAMNRAERRQLFVGIARDLAGPIYGHMVSFEEAKTIILGGNVEREKENEYAGQSVAAVC